MSRLSEYTTTPPNSQVSLTCSNWVGSFILVPAGGLEPPRCFHRLILSQLRVPFRHAGIIMGASIIIPYCTHFFKYYLRKKLILDAEHKDDEHDERQDIAHIEANAVAYLDAAAVVRLVLEILPSPAIAARTE